MVPFVKNKIARAVIAPKIDGIKIIIGVSALL
jgi:hypothetical protein